MNYSELEKLIGSKLVHPQDKQYDEVRKIWNSTIDRKPTAIAVCETEEDVIAAVLFAQKNQLSISVRGGGHHVAGFAVCEDGLMIDLSNMRKVNVDSEKKMAFVEGGATLGDVDSETQKYGLAVPTGTASVTGIAGLTLNGGMGYLRGKYGLTCDNLVGARLVTADGELIEVNEKQHPDLLWALRGGGGNFGVVTQFQFALHNVGPEILVLDVMYDYKDAKQILQKAQEFLQTAPDEALSINITVTILPPVPFLPEFLHFKKVIMFLGAYVGDPEEGYRIIQPLRELAKPIIDHTSIIPFVDLQKKLDPLVPDHVPAYGTSLYFGEMDDYTIDAILAKIDNAPVPSYLVQFWALGGQMNRLPATATPFAIRDAKYALFVDIMPLGGENEVCKKWVDSLYGGLLPYSHKKASYLNSVEASEDVTVHAFQDNLNRLKEIKKKYDPENRFRHNHNINPN